VLLLLPQPSPTKQLSIPIPSDEARLGFNVREFMDEYRLDAGAGGGAHMWRETWTADVSAVYRDVLSE
jgi:large subunit ribosomal protein L35